MLKIPQSFLRSLAIAKQLSEGELEVLYRITEDQSIDTIAEELKTSPSAIYQRLAQIYSKFEIEGKGPGKLSRLQLLLTSEYENSDFSQKSLSIQENDEITTISQINSTSIPTQFFTMTKPSTLFPENTNLVTGLKNLSQR
jgi:DNA-binding CsgD family transcriptional regulator